MHNNERDMNLIEDGKGDRTRITLQLPGKNNANKKAGNSPKSAKDKGGQSDNGGVSDGEDLVNAPRWLVALTAGKFAVKLHETKKRGGLEVVNEDDANNGMKVSAESFSPTNAADKEGEKKAKKKGKKD